MNRKMIKKRVLGAKLHLFAVKYSELDEPNVYAAANVGQALMAYLNDTWGFSDEYDPAEFLHATVIPDDQVLEYGDGETGREITRTTARELADRSQPNVCVLCDGNYC